MLGGGSDACTIGQAYRRAAACHGANLRVLRRQRLRARAKPRRQKARSEVSVGKDAARAAKSAAVAPRVRVLRPCVFCPGKGRGRGASGWVCRAGFGGRSGDAHPHREDLGPAGKDYRTLAHHLAYLEDEKYVGCIRIYVGLVVKSTSVAAARPESRRPAGRQTCNRGAKHSARVARACSSGQTDRLP